MVYKLLMTFATFLVTLGLLYILRYNETIAVLAATLKQSKGQVSAFGFVFLVVLLAFTALTHVWMGAQIYDFRSVWSSLVRLAVRHMDMDYEETREAGGVFGAVVMLIFCFFTLIVLLNFMITIINDVLAALQADDSVKPKDHEVIDYMFSLFFKSKKTTNIGKY